MFSLGLRPAEVARPGLTRPGLARPELAGPGLAGPGLARAHASVADPAPSGGHFILVIDDEPAILAAMRALLTAWGHEVLTAGSGAEMMAELARCPVTPDLLICDYRLRDGESGIETVGQLQSEYNDELPAILITGDTAPERLQEARASGLLLLHKPVEHTRLRQAIYEQLGSGLVSVLPDALPQPGSD